MQAQSEEQKHQIDALTAQLEHLTASKAQLESRCHLLEKVVKMREEPISANPQARAAFAPLMALTAPALALCREGLPDDMAVMHNKDVVLHALHSSDAAINMKLDCCLRSEWLADSSERELGLLPEE